MSPLLNSCLCSLLFIAGFSCKPEGCTDRTATNFESKAKKENHSCVYGAKVVFWMDQKSSADIIKTGAASLKYYLDGELVGSASADVFWPGAPSCTQTGAVSAPLDLNGSSQRKSFKVIDNLNRVVMDSSKVFISGECNEVRIVHSFL